MATALPPWLQERGEHLRLEVIVSPKASRSRIVGIHDERLKVQIAAPPSDGQANQALVRFIADHLGLARAQVEIVGGAGSTRKTLQIAGLSATHALLKLLPRRGV